ncbi:MAG: (Fe-S)-binding protein [Thermodesulfobacteriota bacterium]|nr:(Fe-S)-binding protein [Thermodesulfobacteriota bacterium]
MLLADTYGDRIDFLRYLPQTDCEACGEKTCEKFVEGLKAGKKKPENCPHISEGLYYPFHVSLNADNLLPTFPCLTDPRPGPTGLVEINAPGEGSPLLVSGNHVHTQEVLLAVLSTTRSPFFLLFADTRGNTVDMAVIYRALTAEQITKDLRSPPVTEKLSHHDIIIPGLAWTIARDLKKTTPLNVLVGPICAAELPLFLADRWLPPGP